MLINLAWDSSLRNLLYTENLHMCKDFWVEVYRVLLLIAECRIIVMLIQMAWREWFADCHNIHHFMKPEKMRSSSHLCGTISKMFCIVNKASFKTMSILCFQSWVIACRHIKDFWKCALKIDSGEGKLMPKGVPSFCLFYMTLGSVPCNTWWDLALRVFLLMNVMALWITFSVFINL